MYVRWVVRHHKNAEVANTSFHDAYLVESYRDDTGKPRQRTICYLGNVRQIEDAFPPVERELFLLRAERILKSIERLGDDDCQGIMHMLQQKVHPLTRSEVMKAFTENLRWCRRWWDEHGNGPSEEELVKLVREIKGRPGPM